MGPSVRRYRVAVMLARIALFIVLDCLIVKIKQGFGIALTPIQLVMTLVTAASFQVLVERMGGLAYLMYRMHVSEEMVLESAITSPDMYRMSGETVQESTITSLGLEEDVDRSVKREGAYGSDWMLLRQIRLLWWRGWDVLTGAGKLEEKTHVCIFCGNRGSEHRLFCPRVESSVFKYELGRGGELVEAEATGELSARKMDANELRNVITKVSKRVRRPFSTETVRPTAATNSEQVNVTLSHETLIDLMSSDLKYIDALDYKEIHITPDHKVLTLDFVLEPDEMIFDFKNSLQASQYSAGTANHKRDKSRNVLKIQEPVVTGHITNQLDSCEGRSTANLTDAKWIITHYLKQNFSVRIPPCPFEILQYRPRGFSAGEEQFWLELFHFLAFEQQYIKSEYLLPPPRPPRMVHISDFRASRRTKSKNTKLILRNKFTCYYCSRVLRRDRFAKRQVSGEFLPGHANALKRFCIDCGIKNKTFKPGNQITIHGLPFRICHDCSIPTLGRFCTQCNTCGSCLGQGEYSGPPNAKCPRCDHKTLRLHVDQRCRELLSNLDEQIHQVRALVNILGACMCEDCSRCMDEFTMKPKAMDIVQQGLQYEVYHFSQIGKLRLSQIPQHWAPAIVREVGGNNMRIGFEDPRLSLAEGIKIPETCYLKECGSAEQLVGMISKGRRTRIPGL